MLFLGHFFLHRGIWGFSFALALALALHSTVVVNHFAVVCVVSSAADGRFEFLTPLPDNPCELFVYISSSLETSRIECKLVNKRPLKPASFP